MFLCLAHAVAAETRPAKEYRVKAVFLYNFAQFVQWPAASLPDDQSPLVVGILGDDPFHSYLDEVVKGEKVNNHPIRIVRYKNADEAGNSHILFVSASEAHRSDAILAAVKSRGILTVGESQDFCRNGGMVCFATESGRIRLKINLDPVQEANLTVSSKLLRLADVTGAKRE
jgi:hypothetical protein